MSWRTQELSFLGEAVRWLAPEEAAEVYERATLLCSRSRYGLDERRFANIARHSAESVPDATKWLTGLVPEAKSEVRLVFGRDQVCAIPWFTFLRQWGECFMPSRDDVVVLGPDDAWVLFYDHEERFEFAHA